MRITTNPFPLLHFCGKVKAQMSELSITNKTKQSSIFEILHTVFNNKYYISQNGNNYSFVHQPNWYKQNKCPIDTECQFVLDPKPQTYTEKRRIPLSFFLKPFTAVSTIDLPSDDIIKSSLLTLKKNLYYFSLINEKGEKRIFTGNTKGTERYNKKVACKIQDQISYFASLNWETFALTITYDVARYGEDRIAAWQGYTAHINHVLEHLRKHYRLEYCWVKESTKKGYPHAHIVLAFPPGTVKSYRKMQNNKSLKYGWLFNEIKKRVDSRVFELRPIKGNNVKYYLTKYINKFSENNLFECCEEKHELTDEERKGCLCLLYTVATHTRQYGMTKFRKQEQLSEEENILLSTVSHIETVKEKYILSKGDRPEGAKALRALRADLIKLCINPPCNMIHDIYSVKQSVLEQHKIAKIDESFIKNPEKWENLRKISTPIGCKGCFWSEFYKLISGQPSKIFLILKNRLESSEYSALVAHLTPFSEDVKFFSALEFIYNYFMELFHTTNLTFNQLVENPNTDKFIEKQSLVAQIENYIELQSVARNHLEKMERDKSQKDKKKISPMFRYWLKTERYATYKLSQIFKFYPKNETTQNT